MVDREILAARLSKLREALRHLHAIAAEPRDEYLASTTNKALSEHYLRIALEAMLDTGNHVIAAKGFRKPLRMRDIPLILAENDLLAGALATKLAGAASLRNLLVHGYCDIDHGVLYDAMQGGLADLEGFAAAIAAALRE